MGSIKAFIFDMDGVLTETSEMHYLAWKAMAESIDIEIDRNFNEQLKGISRRESLEKILSHGNKEFTESEKEVLMNKKNDMYVEMISSFTRENLCPGILQLLTKLKSEGILIGVASASQSAKMLVGLLDIEDYVDYIADPSDMPGKPDPYIFLKAAEGLGVSPGECVAVEDAVAGVEAIKSAGMYAIGIGDEDTLFEADLIFRTPQDIDLGKIIRGFHE